MRISLICAVSKNGVIGIENRLPWQLPADLKRFKRLTMNHHIIMGRKTYQSIGRALPGRISVVVTRQEGFRAKDCRVVPSIEAAIQLCPRDEEIFVVGGASIFEQTLPSANRIYMTLVDQDFEGDTFFPKLDERIWKEISREDFPQDAQNPFPFRFITLEKQG